MDARPAVTAEAQATTPTTIGDSFKYLNPAACQFELAVFHVHDPSERRARVDLAILAMADRAACRVDNGLVCDSPTKAASINVHAVSSYGCLGLKLIGL